MRWWGWFRFHQQSHSVCRAVVASTDSRSVTGTGTRTRARPGTGPSPSPSPASGLATPPTIGTPVAAPAGLGASDYVPLFASGSSIVEQIQYTEADGTLVTYAGFRPTNRHAREGGEPWTDTIDAGPGNYFTFPAFYFQHRTYGLIIATRCPPVVKRSPPISIRTMGYSSTTASARSGGSTRASSNMAGSWVSATRIPRTAASAAATSTRSRTCAWPRQSSGTIGASEDDKDYKGETTRASNGLVIGDKIEMSPGVFPDFIDGSTVALIDGGTLRNYAFEQLYVVGKGMVPWYGTAPYLDTTPLPDDALLGGQASVSYNYSEEPHRVFQQSANNIGPGDMQRFVEGRRLFHISYLDGKHSENPDVNPVFTEHAGQLGDRYNEVRCLGCHTLNGRSPAADVGTPLNKFGVLTAAASTSTGITPDPVYGVNVQQLSRTTGAPDYGVTIQSFAASSRTLPDGTVVSLQRPVYKFNGPVPKQLSVRQAPQVVGMGLLEAVDEKTILDLADPADKDGDGVKGVPNWAIDPETGQRHLGSVRLEGWQGQRSPSDFRRIPARPGCHHACVQDGQLPESRRRLQHQHRNAFDLECRDRSLASYMELLGVPSHRKYTSGYTLDGNGKQIVPPPEETSIDPAKIARGAQLFTQAACTTCHVPQLKTGNNHPFQELRNQTIHPYTDLLLHDMGPDLADTLTEGQAGPSMWRTSPLWGLGLAEVRTGADRSGRPEGRSLPSRRSSSNAGRGHRLARRRGQRQPSQVRSTEYDGPRRAGDFPRFALTQGAFLSTR